MIWPFIIFAYVSLFSLAICDNFRGPLYPELISQFNISNTNGALFFAISSFASFLGSFASQQMLKFLDRVSCLRFSVLLMSISMFGISTSDEYQMILLFSGIFGFSLGMVGVFQNSLASVGAPKEFRSRVLTGLHSMYGVGSLLAPLLVTLILSLTNNWRKPFLFASVLALFVFLASFLVKIKSVKSRSEQPHLKMRLNIDYIMYGFLISFYVISEIMISSRLVLFMQKEYLFGIKESNLFLTLFFICLLIGRVSYSILPVKTKVTNLMQICLIGSFSLILLGVFIHPLFLVLTGFSMSIFYPLSISHISHIYHEHVDEVLSLVMGIQSLCVVFMHMMFGFITDMFSIKSALMLGPICLLISFIILKIQLKRNPHV